MWSVSGAGVDGAVAEEVRQHRVHNKDSCVHFTVHFFWKPFFVFVRFKVLLFV